MVAHDHPQLMKGTAYMKILAYTTIALFIVMLLSACNNQAEYYPQEDEIASPYVIAASEPKPPVSTPQIITITPKPQPLATPEPVIADTNTFITTKRIHEDMPEFTFIRTLVDYIPGWCGEVFCTSSQWSVIITILDEEGNLIQTIDGIRQGGESEWMTADHDLFELRFDDFNFDGYMDMWLHTSMHHRGFYSNTLFWLWNPEANQFETNNQLNSINFNSGFRAVNHETRQIETISRVSIVSHRRGFYEYHAGEFIRVASEFNYFDFNPNFAHYVWKIERTDILTGEVTTEHIIADTTGVAITDLPEITIVERIESNNASPPMIARLDIRRLYQGYSIADRLIEYETTITIFSYHGNIIQEITGLKIASDTSPILRFEDFNRDGHLDMMLRVAQGGSMRNDPHYIWLWDVDARQFVLHEELTELSFRAGISINENNWLGNSGNIHAFSRGGMGYYLWESYAFIDDIFTLIETRVQLPDYTKHADKVTIINFINGTESIHFIPWEE